jgi:hypothetical protein
VTITRSCIDSNFSLFNPYEDQGKFLHSVSMKSTLSFLATLLVGHTFGDEFLRSNQTAPKGCRKLSSDNDWPTVEVWKTALPGIMPGSSGTPGPDYRIQAKSVADVQRAVKFANEHNIRISVITTGHDQIGRSISGSGLLIDLSLLSGIKVLESFTPTVKGAQSPSSNKANVIVPEAGIRAAVTIGPGVNTQGLNNALSPSKLMTSGGTHGMSL